MHRVTLFVFAAVVAGLPACTNDENRTPAHSGHLPSWMEFWDADHGVVHLSVVDCDECEAVEETGDGGRTWRRRPDPDAPTDPANRAFNAASDWDRDPRFEILDVVDGRTAWALRRRGSRLVGMARTEDAGRTSLNVRFPCPRPSEGDISPPFSAPTATRAWFLCQGAVRVRGGFDFQAKSLYATTDGGRSWRRVAAVTARGRPTAGKGMPAEGMIDEMSFAANGFGLITGVDAPFVVTQDGGATWRPAAVPDKGGAGLPRVGSGTIAYVVLDHRFDNYTGTAWLYKTEDAGRTWKEIRVWIRD